MNNSLKLAHVCLLTTDLPATEEFYCGILGLKRIFDFNHKGNLHGFYLEFTPGNYLEVFKTNENFQGGKSAIQHLCIETDDIHGMAKKLRSAGVDVTEVKKGADNTWQCWFVDPNGVSIEFHQYTEESSQTTGKAVEVDWL